jgi:hypothetical protein
MDIKVSSSLPIKKKYDLNELKERACSYTDPEGLVQKNERRD